MNGPRPVAPILQRPGAAASSGVAALAAVLLAALAGCGTTPTPSDLDGSRVDAGRAILDDGAVALDSQPDVVSDAGTVDAGPPEVDSGTDAGPAYPWGNTLSCPALTDPMIIEVSRTTTRRSIEKAGCTGEYYEVRVPTGVDAIVRMAPGEPFLELPLWVTGGANVRVVGVDIRPSIPAGCDTGEAHQLSGYGSVRAQDLPNLHPRVAGDAALRMAQEFTSCIEGVNMDLGGAEADCVVIRNWASTDATPSAGCSAPRTEAHLAAARAARDERHILMINTRCTGYEGWDNDAGPSRGDGVHGDVIQNQGCDPVSSLRAENISVWSSSNGITMHGWYTQIRMLQLRNFSYSMDPRYYGDDPYENSAGLVYGSAGPDEFEFECLQIDEGRGLNYVLFAPSGGRPVRRIGALGASGVTGHPGINSCDVSADTHEVDFAPLAHVGLSYIAPAAP